jgi:hypothetical protein
VLRLDGNAHEVDAFGMVRCSLVCVGEEKEGGRETE